MATITLTAGDLSAAFGAGAAGYLPGFGGSTSGGSLLDGFTDATIFENGTAVNWACNGNAVASLASLTHLKIDGVDYAVTVAPTFDGTYTNVSFAHRDFTVGNPYTLALVNGDPPPTYAGPTFHAQTTAAGSVNATSINFNGAVAAGDKMIIAVMTANQTVAAPSGFTQRSPASGTPQRGTAGTAGGVRLTLFERDSDGTETVVAIGDSGDIQYAVGFVFRGAAGATVTVDSSVGGNAAASTSGSFSAPTSTVDDCLYACFIATDRDAAAASWGSPGGGSGLANMTERFDNGTSAGSGGGIALITGEKVSAGAVGNITSTQAASAAYCWITLALKNADPAPAILPYSFGFVA